MSITDYRIAPMVICGRCDYGVEMTSMSLAMDWIVAHGPVCPGSSA